LAPKGTRLPVTPKLKASASARYEWTAGTAKPYTQIVATYSDSATAALRTADAEAVGRLSSATTLDWAIGATWNDLTAELYVDNLTDERAEFDRRTRCSICTRVYSAVETPRTIGVRVGSKF
jgi:outer membrane receptor protein involved in Fe transport